LPAGGADTLVETTEGDGDGHGDHGHGIHMPSPSYMPILTSLGLPAIGYGLIYGWYISAIGALIVLGGLYAWALEPGTE
jgi:cytochrome c oxidase subunit 1